jgi:GNAT superfamily N-acetyltransferase
MTDVFVYCSSRDPRAKPLIEDLTFEYDTRYGDFFEKEGAVVEMNRYPPEAFAPPHGNFLLLMREDEAIAGGAFMRHAEGTAEFKRIWTRRDFRRQGLARIYLTTGCRQPEAAGLYLTNGYTALFDLNADLEALRHLAFEKVLSAHDLAGLSVQAAE